MRAAIPAILGALALAAVTACSGDEKLVDAPPLPTDAAVPIDGNPACNACGPGQICVAYHDGTCSPNILVECQERNPACQGGCVQGSACEFWHCKGGQDAGSPYVCYYCPNDIAGALNCHGP